TATIALLSSFICCMLSPLLFYMSPVFLIGFMVFWGLVVIADSPMFSTLVAHHTTPESKGTALTIVNFIGFAITIISVELINGLQTLMKPEFVYMLLAVGPALGLLALWKRVKK
ncbi:MAG: MFS transporter, partial [Bacteroidota bacterium]